MVVTGEKRAYVRRYRTASAAVSPSAPIIPINSGAQANITAPVAAPVTTIMRTEQVKMLFASSSRFLPRLTEMGTADPTPIRSASAKLMMTNGKARLSAANDVSPNIFPTKNPSNS